MRGKHTPGPWTWDRDFIDAGMPGHHRTDPLDSGIIVYGPGDNDYWEIQSISDADATLMATAPDLLEALERFVKAVSLRHWQEQSEEKLRDALNIAKAVIAKARRDDA